MLTTVVEICPLRTLPVLALLLAVVVFGGGALFYVGRRFIAKEPDVRYWPSAGVNLLATIAGLIAMAAVQFASTLLGPIGGPIGKGGAVVGGLLTAWLIVKALTRLPFDKAAKAWLPTLGILLIVIPLLLLVLHPVWVTTGPHPPAYRHLRRIAEAHVTAQVNGRSGHQTTQPVFPDLQSLVKAGYLSADALKDPDAGVTGRECDYFYRPLSIGDQSVPSDALLACTYADSQGGRWRIAVRVDMSIQTYTPEDFEGALALPENAAFAAALRAEEARQGITPNR